MRRRDRAFLMSGRRLGPGETGWQGKIVMRNARWLWLARERALPGRRSGRYRFVRRAFDGADLCPRSRDAGRFIGDAAAGAVLIFCHGLGVTRLPATS